MGNDKWKKKIDHDGKQIVLCVERLQDELAKINQEASGELLKVAQKYNRIHQPIYEKRTNIIKYIPDFWLKSFLKHRGLVCAEEDRKIFEFLSSIKLEQSQDVKSGKGVDERSFFKWFSEADKRDEIGEMIKDELWSDPLICFHYEAEC
ncbi:hypothetical protein KY289_013390 [Solanum tuberosum]|nr:hypothetical protein KY289_013390 [Solanum tuberosum]KAH0698545.1 hypothetical protein KY284_012760 [Solanum tuberosum]